MLMQGKLRIARALERLSGSIMPPSTRLPAAFSIRDHFNTLDPLIERLPEFVSRSGSALDIGANEGMFTVALAKIATKVEAFEPQASLVEAILPYASRVDSNVAIHNCALSDRSGEMTLQIPLVPRSNRREYLARGLASLGTRAVKEYNEVVRTQVSVKRLDDFRFRNVSFIKIDVEGHESCVLAGALETIRACHPVMLIEIEERHLDQSSVADIIRTIELLGYDGFFFIGDLTVPASAFDFRVHQEPFLNDIMRAAESGRYINNFIFIPST
jgi:FkbM family methyltransferase